MTAEQPSLFQTAKVQQWQFGTFPYILENECPVCGWHKVDEVPPASCPKCGTILTGGMTRKEINDYWAKEFGKETK